MRSKLQSQFLIAIRFRQFGDVLATLDALKALKEAKPDRPIAFIVDECYHELLRGETYIDLLVGAPPRVNGIRGLLAFVDYARSLRKLDASTVLDFHSNARSAFLTLLSGARDRVGYDVKVRKAAYTTVVPRAGIENGRLTRRNSAASALELAQHAGIGLRARAMLPEIALADGALAYGRGLLVGAGVTGECIDAGEVVGLNPGKPYPAKAWPEEYFVTLARTLCAKGKRVVILWGPGELEVARRIQSDAGEGVVLSPEVSLAELPGYLKHFKVVVTIDSGLKHMAVCARVPTVTIFGSTNPAEWHMGTRRDRYLWRAYSCSPCRRLECPFGAPCMTTIKPEEVLREIEEMER